jgi:hypothetical protein
MESYGAIILVAVVGKFLGSARPQNLLDRTGRHNWCLDEHKGLMELIVLNILELKVLTPEVFTMMMIMALVTTL